MSTYPPPRQTTTYPKRPAGGDVTTDDPASGEMPLPPPMPQGQMDLPPLPSRAQPAAPGGGTTGGGTTSSPPPAPPPAAPAAPAPSTVFNFDVDPNAAQRAWQAAGSPPTGDVNAWFKNAVNAGVYNPDGTNRSLEGHTDSGYGAKTDITGMRAYSKQHGMSEDFYRYDEATLVLWEKQKDSNCPPNAPYQAYDGSGCIEKPIDSNKGGTAAGGGGGGGGGVFSGGTGGAAGWGLSAEEKGYLNSLTALSDTMRSQSEKLFATGMPAYQLTTERWKKLMGAYGRGGVDAALGPAREGIEESYAGARSQLRGQRGAEKAASEATLARSEAGDLGRLPAEQQAQAAAGLQSAAQFGISSAQGGQGQSAAVIAGQESAVQSSRLAEEGYATQSQIAQLQASTSWDIAALSASVNREQIAAQQGLAQQELAQRSYEFEQNYAYQNAALNAQINQWNQQTKSANRASTGALIGTGVGVAAGIIII